MGFELHTIAQSEHKAFIAKFNRPEAEGMTVATPNIIDRALATIRNAFTRRPQKHASYKQAYARIGAAK